MTSRDTFDFLRCCVTASVTIRDMVRQMDDVRIGVALIVDEERRLVGIISDGDIRRAVLANVDFDQPVTILVDRKVSSRYARPITARVGQEPAAYLAVLKQHGIMHLPLLDEGGRVVDLVRWDDFIPESPAWQAVIMAGGIGARLLPLTAETPKPMLPLGDRPLMEIMIRQLKDAGIGHVHVSTRHKSEKITAHFGGGEEFGVKLSYVEENRPLGTAGALGLMAPPQETLLVINGDILTQVDFRAMRAYHHEHQADLTVAVRRFELQVPYGVIECDGPRVSRLSEKPVIGLFVNAGIYLLEPAAHRRIPQGERFDMTDLIQRLLDEGRPVTSFPIHEYWLDIGQHDDYQRAQQEVSRVKVDA